MKNSFKLASAFCVALLAVGAGVALSGTSKAEVKEAEAADHTKVCTLRGSFDGKEDWGTGKKMIWSEADGKYKCSATFVVGNKIKVVADGAWYGGATLDTYGWTLFTGSGDSDMICQIAGTYTIGITEDNQLSAWFTETAKCYIEYSDVTNAHIWNNEKGVGTQWPGMSVFTESDPYYRGDSKATLKYAVIDINWIEGCQIIFNCGQGGAQTGDLVFGNNFVYASSGGLSTASKSENCTNALAFVKYWRTLRKNGSICPVVEDTAKLNEVVSKYDNLGADAQDLVNNVSDYNDDFGEHTIQTTIEYLKSMILKQSLTQSNIFGIVSNNSNVSVLIVVISSLVAVSAIGGFFYIRKRRHN